MKPATPIVVVSDIDGVLVNPQGTSFATAAGVLDELGDVPLILCSSRTRAELEFIQQRLGIGDPFICENGAALFVPNGYFAFDVPGARDLADYQAVEFGRTYADVVDTLHRVAERLRIAIVGFSDMSIQDVARECGLSLLHARLAKLREYEEPFRILDSDPDAQSRLLKALHGARLRCTRDNRYNYAGAPVDSSVGVTLLNRLYRRASGVVVTIGITDSLRDESLFGLVDYPIMVRNDDRVRGTTIDVVDWAETIVDIVQDVRRKSQSVISRTLP